MLFDLNCCFVHPRHTGVFLQIRFIKTHLDTLFRGKISRKLLIKNLIK